MKRLLLLLLCVLSIQLIQAQQSLYFPPLTGSEWETVSPEELGWCTEKIQPLYDFLDAGDTKAFIVLKGGRIVLEKYFDDFTVDSVWYWASAGKSLMATLVGVALQEGHLSLDDPAARYIGSGYTSCDSTQEQAITIRHQLTMTSGLDDGVPDNHCTLDTCLRCIAEPGTRWAYHNAPYTLLEKVLENATGFTLNQWHLRSITAKTGITGLFIQSGYNMIFASKARSMARFGLLAMNNFRWANTPLITDTAYARQMVTASQSLNPAYGYLWWLNNTEYFKIPGFQINLQGQFAPSAPKSMFAAMGKNGQIINIVPDQELVYVRMGNSSGSSEVPVLYNDTIWQKLNKVMCSTVGINLEKSGSDAGLWPNPAGSSVNINWPGHTFSLQLYDQLGRLVYQFGDSRESALIHTDTLSAGIYFAVLESEKGTRTLKLLKNPGN